MASDRQITISRRVSGRQPLLLALAATAYKDPDDFVVAGYLPEWRYEGAHWADIASVVTHLILFSIEVTPTGALAALEAEHARARAVARVARRHAREDGRARGGAAARRARGALRRRGGPARAKACAGLSGVKLLSQ